MIIITIYFSYNWNKYDKVSFTSIKRGQAINILNLTQESERVHLYYKIFSQNYLYFYLKHISYSYRARE